MTGSIILEEIRRTAAANRGVALGRERFSAETGIQQRHWYGKYWARWGDAIREAGLQPNVMQEPFSEAEILPHLVTFIRELGRYPTHGEIRLRERNRPGFPTHGVFTRLGSKQELVRKVLEYCHTHAGHDDVAAICSPLLATTTTQRRPTEKVAPILDGFVYLLKSGPYYKIGRTNALGPS